MNQYLISETVCVPVKMYKNYILRKKTKKRYQLKQFPLRNCTIIANRK